MFLSSYIKNIRGPWMVSPELAAMMLPILNATLRGEQISMEKVPVPYNFCATMASSPQVKANLKDKVVHVIHLQGTMMKYDSCDDPGTRSLAHSLLEADKDESVIGHVIVVDSGGGSSASVSELSSAMQKLGKPVVSLVDGTAASAAIYAISYSDKILAHDSYDQVGCIGTMVQLSGFPKFSKDSDGYVTARVYASQAVDKNNAYEEALEGNAEVIREEVLNPLNEQFIADMKANRPAVKDDQLTGKTYFAKDVVGTLIDGIGTMDDAVQAVIDLASANDMEGNSKENQIPLDMSKYKFLEMLPGFTGLVCDPEDGCSTLQPSQLDAIEAALAQLDEAKAAKTQNEDLLKQISEKDSKIASLQESLDAANKIIDEGKIPSPEQKKDVSADPEDEFAPAKTSEEAMAACMEFLNEEC